MALIKDGYWQDTYWGSRYWQEDYWPEYGFVNPASVGAPSGARGRVFKRHRRKDLFEDPSFLRMLEEFVEII